jgi:hypothetical protein
MKKLLLIVIFIIIPVLACSEQPTQIIDLDWQPVEGADGYRLYVTTYYDRQDRSLSTEKSYDAGNVTAASIEVPQTSDMTDTAVVNVCIEIVSYNQYDESKRSTPVCLRPWPPDNIRVE